ncbi:MAG TPA: winged helix-turn-helix domain-containing protein [Blastocatellia bacterium]|nr:winged helix-turn-helix domain-containing protein [Blastocatellia bacterium]
MNLKTKRLYEFGPFRLDAEEAVLLRDGKPVYLKPKVFETLLVLVESRGRVLDKETLMQRLWQDSFVEEANLTVNISQLRKALGQAEGGDQFIETVPRRGYRFTADVREVWEEEAALVVKEYSSSHITIEERETESTPGPAVAKEGLPGRIAQPRKLLMAVAASAVVLVCLALLAVNLFRAKPQSRFGNMKITRITNNGRIHSAAISPDGRYIAYVIKDGEQRSLWVKYLVTNSNIQITPPEIEAYMAPAFSRDSNYIYFAKSEPGSLYRVPSLGGPPMRLLTDLSSQIALSPDSQRFAFVRQNHERGETSIWVANSDGTHQEEIAARKQPDSFTLFSNVLSWSPDGRVIACVARGVDQEGVYNYLVQVRLEDKKEDWVSQRRWKRLTGITWVPDGSGVLVTGSERAEGESEPQVWAVSYPGGEVDRVTNDLNSYFNLGVTSDSSTLITVQQSLYSSIWVAPDGDAARADQVTLGNLDGQRGCAWTADGKIVFSAKTDNASHNIWIMDADGSNKKQLTNDSYVNTEPTSTRDGRYVLYTSVRAGRSNIWRMEIDGGNAKQLTAGENNRLPQCSADGKWVVYEKYEGVNYVFWKVSIDGGEPVRLTENTISLRPAISPDGKSIACHYEDEAGVNIAIIPIEGGEPTARFGYAPGTDYGGYIRWTPDGRALTYITYLGSGDSRIWIQPTDGGAARVLTDFKSGQVFYFDWSPDGKNLVVAHGNRTTDVVLISNSK